MKKIFFILMFWAATVSAQTNYRGAQIGLFPSTADVQALIDTGANLARFQVHSVGWDAARWVSCNDYKRHAHQYLDYLNTLLHLPISWVVDLHVPIGGRENLTDFVFADTAKQNCMVELWIEIAHRVKGQNRVLAYDLYNEPLGTAPQVNKLMTRLYTAIRAVDSTKIVILAGRHHAASSFENIKKRDDRRVWYSFHFYDPGIFTHHGVFQPSNRQAKFTGSADSLRRFMAAPLSFKKKHPTARIYVGEFGASFYTEPASRLKWFRDCITIFEQEGFNWTFHAWREWEGWGIESNAKILKLFREAFKKN